MTADAVIFTRSIMQYSKRFINFMNRKSPIHFPDWLVESWYKQFQDIDFSFE